MTQKKENNKEAGLAVTDLTFEQTLARLNDLAARLEAGELALEESLKAYEEGMKLAKHAEAQLEAAEVRVEKMTHQAQAL